LTRDEALAELARRYFQSHGPATLRDFAWWSGLTMNDARAAAASIGAEVVPAPTQPDRVSGATYLLPNYDEYLVAYKDRAAVVDADRARNLGIFTSAEHPHHVIVDGRVAGSWRRTIASHRLKVEVATYEPPRPVHERAVAKQARRYAQFLNLELELRGPRAHEKRS
jgi:hypothetical protein